MSLKNKFRIIDEQFNLYLQIIQDQCPDQHVDQLIDQHVDQYLYQLDQAIRNYNKEDSDVQHLIRLLKR